MQVNAGTGEVNGCQSVSKTLGLLSCSFFILLKVKASNDIASRDASHFDSSYRTVMSDMKLIKIVVGQETWSYFTSV